MSAANIRAGIRKRFLLKHSAAAAAKDAPVCPDGKEKSVGRGTKSCIATLTSQGRILATNGFKITLQQITSKTSPSITADPALRVFGKRSSITADTIRSAFRTLFPHGGSALYTPVRIYRLIMTAGRTFFTDKASDHHKKQRSEYVSSKSQKHPEKAVHIRFHRCLIQPQGNKKPERGG